MRCQYCNKRLGIVDILRGREYCSPEHRQLHLNASLTAYERLSASFTDPAPKKPIVWPSDALADAGKSPEIPAAQLKAKPEAEQTSEAVEAQPTVISGQESAAESQISNLAEAVSEVPAATPAAESTVGQEAPLEIASLADALESTRGSVLPAPFLPEMASPQAPPELELEGYTAELLSAMVPRLASAVESAVLRSPRPTIDFLFTEPAPVTKSGGGEATWLNVPENYPPVVVTPLATLVLDPKGTDLIPAPIKLPHSGPPPDPILPAGISEPLLQLPVLPEAQPQRGEAEPSALLAGLALIAAHDSAWTARQGPGYPAEPLLDPLPPERHLSLITPPFAWGGYRSLPGSAAFIFEIHVPMPGAEGPPAPVPNLPTALVPRIPQIDVGAPGGTARHLPSAGALGSMTMDAAAQMGAELPLSEPLAAGPRSAVRGEPVRIPAAALSMRTEFKAAAVPLTLEYAAISGTVQALQISATFISAPPAPLLLPRFSSIPALRLPWCSGIEHITLRAPDLASLSGATRPALSAAYLHPSLPSPLSLVTWSQSISVTIQTCEPSYLSRTAPVAWSARPMLVPGLRPSAPGRGQRLSPLLPLPGSVAETPIAPTPGSQWPFVVYPIRPSADGTAAPDVIANRLLAASLPALPAAFSAAGAGPQTGPANSGPMREDAYGLLSQDMAPVSWAALGELGSECGAVLPAWRARRYTPAMIVAPANLAVTSGVCPPVETGATIQPFGVVPRLAWSLIAYPAPMDLDPTLNSQA